MNTVFQDYALFPHLTVGENVEYGLKVRRVGRAERRTRAADALAMVRLDGFGARRITQLSGGQRQRVALARALVNRPKVLLLDEPLGALDLKLREEMQVELKRIQAEVGITFIYVTHDQDEALAMSDRLAVFSDGRLEQVGPPAEVYERPASAFVAGFVGTSNVIDGDLARRLRGSDRGLHRAAREDPPASCPTRRPTPPTARSGPPGPCAPRSTSASAPATRSTSTAAASSSSSSRTATPPTARAGSPPGTRRPGGVGPRLRPGAADTGSPTPTPPVPGAEADDLAAAGSTSTRSATKPEGEA